MREDYRSVNDVQLKEKKKYLLKICQKEELRNYVYDCITNRQFNQMMSVKSIKRQFYIIALKRLYQTSNFEDLEYHLIMMNALFDYQSYNDLKQDLLKKICKRRITIDEYCVIRHLIDFKNTPFAFIIEKLNNDLFVNDEECAKICLLEDEYQYAYQFLKRLDDCQNDNLLDLLSSYSFSAYLSLKKHYERKKSVYQLVPSH